MSSGNASVLRPLCFVLMPFGRKEAAGQTIDFDQIYKAVLQPAIEDARLVPIRADEERAGGIIHKPMFERLLLCDYAVADLTTANANVYYELGVRHATRPRSTINVFAEGTRLPFDLGMVRGISYRVDGQGLPIDVDAPRAALTAALTEARQPDTDSPIFQLVGDMRPPDISRLKTDVFRERVDYSSRVKARLSLARTTGVEAIRAVEADLDRLQDQEAGVLVDLLLSYRAVSAWDQMLAVVDAMPAPVSQSILVREQYAFALNRAGRGAEAETVLVDLLNTRGPSSETYGILGRVYKDRWEAALTAGQKLLARGVIDKAINAYLSGFEADWRDAYPGINAVELMELRDPPDARRTELIPVVAYSVRRRLAKSTPDYWDYATLLELAVLADDQELAVTALADALATCPEGWQRETTAASMRRIREARERRGAAQEWLVEIERDLTGGG